MLKKEIIRFIMVGATNTLLAYLLFALFIFVGIHYTVATLLAGIITMVLGFTLMSLFVFQNKTKARPVYFVVFFAIQYFLNIAFQYFMYTVGMSNEYLVGGIAIVVVAVYSFLVNKNVVFR